MVWASILLLPLGASFSLQTPLIVERQATTIEVPATVPNGASDVVDHGYPGGFSSDEWCLSNHSIDLAVVNTPVQHEHR